MRRLFSNGLLVFALVAGRALAGDLTARVLDPQLASISGARIQLTRGDASWTTSVVASGDGTYRFEALPPGSYLLSASAPGFSARVLPVRIDNGGPAEIEIRLELAAVSESVVVTGADRAERLSESTKTLSVVDSEEVDARDEYFVPEALRAVPGVRMEQLGGPGSFTSLKIRGLRTEDTAVLLDGARLRDPSAPQGDASSYIENLVAPDLDRVEILRGSGSSLHGTNAGGGVINIVTASGGGVLRGSLLAEAGGLGFFRASASTSGGIRDRFLYSLGASQVNVSEGVDGDDASRNTSFQGRALLQMTPYSSLSFRFYGSGAELALNEGPITKGALPEGEIEAIPDVNYVPSANDPDNRREGSFYSSLLTYEQKPSAAFSYSLRYHGLITTRRFDEGPLGVSPFEPSVPSAELYDGGIHTLGARGDYEWGSRQVLHAGYELERESFENRSILDPSQEGSFTDVSQSSHTLYVQDQISLLEGALSLSGSARAQFFSLDEPRFEPEEGSPYRGVDVAPPDDAFIYDLSAGYAFSSTGTRLRTHLGSGYRAPSLYERFGASFSTFGYSVYGDPRLSPERTLTVDVGVEQLALNDRARMEATYFRTRLSEIIAFDFSGAIDPSTDPFGRSGGYLSTDGGVTRGLELALSLSPRSGLDLKASYTFTDAEPPRGVSPDQEQAFAIPRHQLALVAAKSFGAGVSVAFDLLASSSYIAPVFDLETFSSRVYRFEGYVKADVVASYRLPVGGTGLRFFGKVENLFDETIHASGFRTPGRYAVAGAAYEF
jgi:iron complex outermembrane receptor protein